MATAPPLRPSNSSSRLGSIDAYRGLVMFLMMAEVLRLSAVSAKFPDSAFWKFLAFHQSHVPWAGCSLHDLIQPSFSFLVGVSLPFSIASREAKGRSRARMIVHAIWRAALLVLLGVFLRSVGRQQTNWTFEDTLSQIGFGYVPLFLLGFTPPAVAMDSVITILVSYWAAFAWYYPPSDFEYAKYGVPPDWPYHYNGLAAHWNKNSNLAWAFDTWLLNLFPRAKPFFFNGGGYATLSFIPTLATMILGLIAGRWLQHKPEAQARVPAADRSTTRNWRTVGWLIITGAILIALGLLAHGSLQIPYAPGWDNVSLTLTSLCPCVKRIWTPSWVLYSGGWCFLLLAGFYAILDVANFNSWSFPLRVIGANSIAAYLLAHGPDRMIQSAFHTHLGRDFFKLLGAPYESLLAGTAILLIEWLILYWLYRQKIHIRI